MNTKFKSIVTGAILEPNSEMVAEQLRKNPSFVVYDGQEAPVEDEQGRTSESRPGRRNRGS